MTLRFGTSIVRTKEDGTEKILDFEVAESYEEAAEIVDAQNAKGMPEGLRWAVASIRLADNEDNYPENWKKVEE